MSVPLDPAPAPTLLAPPVGEPVQGPTGAAALTDQLQRARSALRDGRPQEVLDELQTTLAALAGLTAATWSVLGTAYGQLGRDADRDDAYERAAAHLQHDAGPLAVAEVVDVTPALVATGAGERAVGLLREAATQEPGDLAVACLLADQLDLAGDPGAADAQAAAAVLPGLTPEEVLRRLHRAVELAPDDAGHRGDLAAALLTTGSVDEAAEHLARARELAPDDPQVLAITAEAARLQGDLATASELVEQVLRSHPDHSVALGVAGLVQRDTYVGTQQRDALGVAIDLLRASLAVDPTNTNLRFVLANCLYESGSDTEARDEYTRVIEAWPETALVYRGLGAVLLRLGELSEALDAYDVATAMLPDDAASYAGRALVLRGLRRLDEAMPSFDLAIALDPGNAYYRFERAECLRLAGRNGESLEALDELVAQFPDDATVLGTRGQVLAALGDVQGAEAAYDRAVAADGSLAWLWRARADLFLDEDRAAEALEAADLASTLSPTDSSLAVLRGSLLLQLGRTEESLEAVARALELDPTNPLHHYLHGLALLETDQVAPALDAFDRARELDGGAALGPELHAWRGEALRRLERHAEAMEAFDESLLLDPHNVVALIGMGQSRYATDDLDRALEALMAAASEPAADVDQRSLAEAWAGETLRRQGRTEEALPRLDAAVALQPTFGFALATRGQVRSALGDRQGAIADLEAGIEHNPGLAWAEVDLGELLRLEGRNEDARRHLEAAVAAGQTSAYARGTLGQVLVALGEQDAGIAELRASLALDRQPWVADALANALVAAPVRRPLVVEALEVLAGIERDPEASERSRIDRAAAATTEVDLLTTKAEALRLVGRTTEAMACIELYLVDHPDDVGAQCTQAAVLVDRGDALAGLAVADRLLEADDQLTFARWVRIRALERLERTSDALADVEVLSAQLPGDTWSLTTKASLLSDFQRYDEALAITGEVVATTPDDPYAHAIAGFCLNRLARHSEAAEHLRIADAGDPDVLWYGSELGDALLQGGQDDDATAAYESVLARFAEGDLQDTGSMRSAAWCHLLLGNLDEATALVQASASLEPDSLSGRLLLALVLLRAGRPEVAVDEYEGAAKSAGNRPDPARALSLLEDAKADLARVASPGGSPLAGVAEAVAVLDEALVGLTGGGTD